MNIAFFAYFFGRQFGSMLSAYGSQRVDLRLYMPKIFCLFDILVSL